MRYSKDHKAETHAKIVKHASSQLREKGTRGIGVADLMKEAGLTHGGFYAHFGSREDLVIEAIAHAMDQTTARWGKLVQDKPADERLAMLVDSYLTAQHRDGAARGCAIPSLAADVVRESPKTRRVFLGKLEEMISLFADQLSDQASAAARQKAIATIATLMGTLVLARVAGNSAFSQEILEAGRSAALSLDDRVKPPRKPSPAKEPTRDLTRKALRAD
ncbi:TetR family transcriptional regulator [Streptomyces sp. AcH 505]|uniref:TetR/AcrR family transcriptional regulator n=1 Tax=Streptomyces sp. AcH 505 TaxID=352211 RepID=UPI000591AA29|nr:TetR family transcriptional regulator [Streptomyces sp. AcH 505]